MKLVYDKKDERRYGIIEKDRTSTYKVGQEIENPSYDNWKHIFEDSKNCDVGTINFNKDIEQDTSEFKDDIFELIEEIKTTMIQKIKEKKITNADIMQILHDNNLQTPDEIADADTAKKILETFKGK
jgi:hypothetical protein